jgi:hypothetical protein
LISQSRGLGDVYKRQVVHDVTINKNHLSKILIHEIVVVNTIYTWVDWFIYINLLLSQLDMVLVEISTDIIVTFFITQNYLSTSSNTVEIIAFQQPLHDDDHR